MTKETANAGQGGRMDSDVSQHVLSHERHTVTRENTRQELVGISHQDLKSCSSNTLSPTCDPRTDILMDATSQGLRRRRSPEDG